MTKENSRRGVSRRHLIAGSAAVPLAAPAIARAQDQEFEWNMVTSWPAGAPGVGVNAQRFADRVQAMSGGRISIRLYAAGELVPPFECLDAVEQGTADLAHGTPYYWAGKAPALHFFTGVPFGMTALEMTCWIKFAGGQELWEEVYAPFNVVPFYAGSSGVQAGGWFNRAIDSVDDFQGLKFRIAGLGADVLKRLGVEPVLMAPGDIFTALTSGQVDAADWVGPWNDLAFGLNKVAHFYYMPGFHEPGPSLEVIVNKDRFAGLPEDLQAIVRAAAEATALETTADFQYHNTKTFPALKADPEIEVRHWPDEVVARVRLETAAVLEELAATDDLTRRVYESHQGYLAESEAYAPWSELGYLAMRQDSA
jgi:TRAP-type mannitol/chloroaromatic compound transport system substrate-binding protein